LVGFKNDSGGYEIRNKYSKICLGKKDVLTIKNDSENLKIFEGFFDFLSFKNIEKSLENESSDYVILNSVSMISKIKNSLENYKKIDLYFDNDEAGNKAVKMLKNEMENVKDFRVLYSDFKDLNEWAMSSTKLEEKLGGSLVQKVPKVYNKRGR
jgi:5S rRNA maturation endonuclease (ribonuclease M5)